MITYTATYSPDDNKLRLSASSRLDAETYQRVKDAGFKWAPKQEIFVAPMWTPAREDLCLELAGEIEDDDRSLVDRAEERADRFSDYSSKRGTEANQAYNAVGEVAKRFEFGQPILVGHHSERKARKDQERIEQGMQKAVSLWETSKYWQSRAAGALRHAKYKELPGVRFRRMKSLESDKRKQERNKAEAEKFLKAWEAEGLTMARAKFIANHSHISHCFTLIEYPRELPASQCEGAMSLWSALDGGVINEIQARDITVAAHRRTIAWAQRWIAHYDNRIAYERAMLSDAADGALPDEKFDVQIGGRVLVQGEWLVVLRVNKKDGRTVSVSTNARYVRVKGIEQVTDYKAPDAEEAAKVQKVTKIAPISNYPGEGFAHITQAEWDKIPKDYRGTDTKDDTATAGRHRVRKALGAYVLKGERDMNRRHAYPYVFITDAKKIDPPAAPAGEQVGEPVTFERQLEVSPAPAPVESAKVPTESAKFDTLRDALRQGVRVLVAPQLFPTPETLADRMVVKAKIQPGDEILEPEVGTGRIVQAVAKLHGLESVKLTAVEIKRELSDLVASTYPAIRSVCADFLQCGDELGRFDVILMNPPFVDALDIAHILHALPMIKPGGRLVAICANGPRQVAKLRPMVEQNGGEWEDLPPGTFEESGTNVRTALLTFYQ